MTGSSSQIFALEYGEENGKSNYLGVVMFEVNQKNICSMLVDGHRCGTTDRNNPHFSASCVSNQPASILCVSTGWRNARESDLRKATIVFITYLSNLCLCKQLSNLTTLRVPTQALKSASDHPAGHCFD
jgi:hypothetical protein